ncbi:hypothetical protein BKA83DRAFT_4128668 [Pisolithus microcarpus]|nr:hypothetical protein BKA83DRAFT_4128668 [Pisolithus microcarpus]
MTHTPHKKWQAQLMTSICPKCLKFFTTVTSLTFHQAQLQAACNVCDGLDMELILATPANEQADHDIDTVLVASFPSDSQPAMDFDPGPTWDAVDSLGRVFITFPCATEIFEGGETFLTWFELDPYSVCWHLVPFYPFSNLDDWKVANFLLTSGLSMKALNKFLSLKATKNMPLSFWMAKDLCAQAELLPSEPIQLYFQDALDCVEALFNHPFLDKMDFTPFRSFTTAEHLVRVFTEWMSSDGAWDMQSCEYQNEVPRMCMVLQEHLFHQCLDIILEPLKQAACLGQMMSDPVRNLPEAHMLAYVHSNTSPITTAMYKNFGDPYCHPPHTTTITLVQLSSIKCDVLDVNHVSHPFWRNWLLAEPSEFLTPESLHEWHCQFWDHDIRWCKQALGAAELDFRFSIIPRITGLPHFSNGIMKLKQVGRRVQRDVQ